MKKKFGLFALVLTVLLCGSLFLFAACGDGEEEEPSATPAISVTVNETARQSGATIEGDTEDTYTIAASVVNGEEGASVTISYVYESGEAEDFSGSTFSPDEAGTYVFTFTAEGASNFTLTFEIAEAQAPVVPVITASADKNEITAGGQVTLTWSATENAQVTVTYTKDGTSASALQPVSGEAFTIADAGKYVFTFAAEGAKPVTVTVTVTAAHTHVWATEWKIEPATATEAGKASRECIASGCTDPVEVQEVTLPALNSDEAEDFYTVTVKTSATCTEKGVSTYAWVKNGEIAFDVKGDVSYAQSAHTDLAYVAAVAPTCTEAGKIAHAYCDGCKKYYNVTGDASSYTIGEEIADGAAGLTGDPATGHSATVSVAFADYLTGDSSDYTWTKDVEATCGSCDGTVTLTVETLEAATFTYSSAEATLVGTIEQGNDTVTVTVTDVPEPVTPVITLSVTLGGDPVEGVENGGEIYACIDTEIEYTATVTGGGAVAITYVYESEEEKALDSATGTFTFDKIGAYVFTLKADGAVDYTFKVNIIAHEGAYAYSAEKQVVVFMCENCGTSIDCAITGITVTGDAGSAYVVDNGDETYTAYGFTVEAVCTGVDGNPVTEIFIPLSDENLVVSSVSGGYKAASVTFAYGDDVTGTTENAVYTVYTVAKTTGNVDAQEGTEWQPKIVDLGADAGEYEYRFVLNMTDRSASNVYNSWVLTLVPANGSTDAAVRPDNYIITNFGRGNGNGTGEATGFTFTTNTDMTKGAEKYLNGFDYAEEGALYFVVTRTFTEGAYKLTISVTQGEYSSTYVVDEPAAVGNGLNIWLGSDHAAYTYSDILYVSKGLTVSSISANPTEVEVAGGTTLEAALANVSVTVSYEEGALTDTVAATACSPEGEYEEATSDTYPITLTYGGKMTTVNVIVNAEHVHSYTNGVCSCGEVCAHTDIVDNVCSTCGATWTTTPVSDASYSDITTGFETWYEFPSEVVLTRANSKIEVTGTQQTELTSNWFTVLWECKQGFTGRLDNYGWEFPDSDSPNFKMYSSSISVTDGTGDDWADYQAIAKDCNFTITFEWKEVSALTVTVVLSNGSMTYTCVYTLPIEDGCGITEWTFHLTAEQTKAFSVTSYSMYTWAEA